MLKQLYIILLFPILLNCNDKDNKKKSFFGNFANSFRFNNLFNFKNEKQREAFWTCYNHCFIWGKTKDDCFLQCAFTARDIAESHEKDK